MLPKVFAAIILATSGQIVAVQPGSPTQPAVKGAISIAILLKFASPLIANQTLKVRKAKRFGIQATANTATVPINGTKFNKAKQGEIVYKVIRENEKLNV